MSMTTNVHLKPGAQIRVGVRDTHAWLELVQESGPIVVDLSIWCATPEQADELGDACRGLAEHLREIARDTVEVAS